MKPNKTALAIAMALAAAALTLQASAAPAMPQVNYQVIEQSVALHVNKDGSYTETMHRVLQPLTIAGVSTVGHVEIAYPANFASVKVLDAYTETVTHQRVPVLPSQIYHQSTQTAVQAPFLSDGHVMSLLYSAVTPGATVHLKYVETFKKPYLPGVYAISEALAPEVPVQATQISITAPTDLHLHLQTRGPWQEHRSSADGMQTLSASASSASVSYPPMNTVDITQYAPMAVISTAGDWTALAHAYDQLAGDALQVTPAIRATAAKAADGGSGEVAVARIYHWLQQHVQSVNVDYHHAGFQPPSAASTLQRGMGDSNANVALLCAMLRAQGIQAVPALISPSARFVPYPGVDPFAFNHFLAWVPAYHLFLDTSTRYAGITALPAADQGRPVLITGNDPQFTHTPGPAPGVVNLRELSDAVLHADGALDGTSTLTSAGWRAMVTRQDMLADRSGRRLEQFMQNNFYLGGQTGSLEVVDVANREDLDKPVELRLRVHESTAAIPGKQQMALLPNSDAIAATLAPFTSQATRSVPSALQPQTIEEVLHLKLPAGMQPEHLPEDRTLTTPFGSYSVHYSFAGGVLDMDKRLQLTQFVVGPQQYPQLHQMALMAVSSQRQGILLRHG